MTRLALAIATIVAAATLALAGCGGQDYDIQPGPAAPSVAGTLSVEEADQANNEAELRLQYLPLPQNLGAGLSTYVAWVQPKGTDRYVKVGSIDVDKKREGRIQFTTPYDNFRVIVTAEKSATTQQPGEPVIVTQEVVTK